MPARRGQAVGSQLVLEYYTCFKYVMIKRPVGQTFIWKIAEMTGGDHPWNGPSRGRGTRPKGVASGASGGRD